MLGSTTGTTVLRRSTSYWETGWVCGVWCVVCGAHVVCGARVWCVVCGVWCVVCGVRCVVCGVWCVV